MNDDYLWDGSGEPDPDVQRLERLLGRLRSVPRLPSLPSMPRPSKRSVFSHWPSVLFPLATAALVALMVGNTFRIARAPRASSWTVASLAGQPRIGASALTSTSRLGVGDTLTTDATSRAQIDVSTIGRVTVEGDTRVRLLATRESHHRLALDRGTMNAFITAPPGEFVVETPSATATDLGCVYTLQVDDSGAGLLSVTAGWVAFELGGRESFVPAGASCRTDPGAGPGTPRYDDADAEWREALEEVDFGQDAGRRAQALGRVLGQARVKDAVTLWHLLRRATVPERGDVISALAARVPSPDGVTREAVMHLDKAALDRWWDALGLGDTALWRKWKRPLP
jgi:hypothetical protein